MNGDHKVGSTQASCSPTVNTVASCADTKDDTTAGQIGGLQCRFVSEGVAINRSLPLPHVRRLSHGSVHSSARYKRIEYRSISQDPWKVKYHKGIIKSCDPSDQMNVIPTSLHKQL